MVDALAAAMKAKGFPDEFVLPRAPADRANRACYGCIEVRSTVTKILSCKAAIECVSRRCLPVHFRHAALQLVGFKSALTPLHKHNIAFS